MKKEIVFDCFHPARFAPRNEKAFVETEKSIIIEKPCPVCRGKNKAMVKMGRIARWLERRRLLKEKMLAELAKKPKIKPAEPIKLNREQRRKLKWQEKSARN